MQTAANISSANVRKPWQVREEKEREREKKKRRVAKRREEKRITPIFFFSHSPSSVASSPEAFVFTLVETVGQLGAALMQETENENNAMAAGGAEKVGRDRERHRWTRRGTEYSEKNTPKALLQRKNRTEMSLFC